ncbi:MBL fold metallo-hydrolase [Suttonella sp. R2A3]|uniref:MBL fold metallo-hydrolase n=1 Tax=Suttonella sp. R2A3 TaxID=2908648 RepID=UPI001F32F157|nr:MBL fold metallo-hydrolase [Suttonella sp. R2A3]UJF25063.1 MBL fold metallo-hydrolase [Suttonella sp. R2A3]
MSHEIIQLMVEDHDNFIHIIADRNSGEAAVVDPAWDAEGIAEVLGDEGLSLTAILITHSHHDHVNAVHELRAGNDQVAVFISELEYPAWPDCPEDAILVSDGDEITFAGTTIGVISTPGHTVGGCCYHIGNDLITGDTLFIYGAGRADLKGSDPHKLFNSLQKLKKLPEETRIWVGHDYGSTQTATLGEQFAHNPFMMIENEADFVRYRLELAAKTRSQPYQPIEKEALDAVLEDA